MKTFIEPTQLLEVVQSTSEVRVDIESSVIRSVRVLGPESLNGRRYTAGAIRGAVSLYEGIHVNYDHPQKGPTQERQFADRAGWLSNVREVNGGLSGDLHFLKTDPRAAKLCEAAERRPESFGLSHNAEGRVVKKDGKTLVEEITRVRSVDIVADPATTRSLFESIENGEGSPDNLGEKNMPKKTMRQIADANCTTNQRAAALKTFLEQDGAPMADVPVEVPSEDPNAEIAAAFEKAAMSICKKMFVGEMDAADGLGKIKELLGQKEKAAEDSGVADPAAVPSPESLQAEIQRLQAGNDIRDQLQESGVKSTPARVKALVALEPAERKELIESWKDTGTTGRGPRPASAPARNIPEGEMPKDAKSFAAALLE